MSENAQSESAKMSVLRPPSLAAQAGAAQPLREELGALSAEEAQGLKPTARAVRTLLLASADDRWPLLVAAVAAVRGAGAGARAKGLFKLAVLALDGAVAPELIDAGALPELAAALAAVPASDEQMACCQFAGCALAALAEHPHCAQPLLAGGLLAAALDGLALGGAACVPAADPPDERAGQLLGVSYACACALACAACYLPALGQAEGGTDEVVALAPALRALLVPGRALRLKVPTCRWALRGEPTLIRRHRIGGGAARCVLNLALRHLPMRAALREAGALAALGALAEDPAQAGSLRAVASEAVAALSDDARPPLPPLPHPPRPRALGGSDAGGDARQPCAWRAPGATASPARLGAAAVARAGAGGGSLGASGVLCSGQRALEAALGEPDTTDGPIGAEDELGRAHAAPRGGGARAQAGGARKRGREGGRAGGPLKRAGGLRAADAAEAAERAGGGGAARRRLLGSVSRRASRLAQCAAGLGAVRSLQVCLREAELALTVALAVEPTAARAAAGGAAAQCAAWGAGVSERLGSLLSAVGQLGSLVAAARAGAQVAAARAAAEAAALALAATGGGCAEGAAALAAADAAEATRDGGGPGSRAAARGGVRRHGAWKVAAVVAHRLAPTADGTKAEHARRGAGEAGAPEQAQAPHGQHACASPAAEPTGEHAQAKQAQPQEAQFLVRWAGRGAPADSWELPSAINEPRAVAAFLWGQTVAQAAGQWAWRAQQLHSGGPAGSAIPCPCAWVPVPLPRIADSLAELLQAEAAEGSAGPLPDGWPAAAGCAPRVAFQPSLEWAGGSKGAGVRASLSRPLPAPLLAVRTLPASHPAAVALAEAHAERAAERTQAAARGGADGADADAAGAGAESDGCPPGARGLFAACALPAGMWVCDYGGNVKRQKRSDRSCYLMELAAEPRRELFLDVDAAQGGSEARFINDYTGLAAEPNAVAKVLRCPTTGEPRIAVLTTRRVEEGAELLLDYGVSFLADWKLDGAAGSSGEEEGDAECSDDGAE